MVIEIRNDNEDIDDVIINVIHIIITYYYCYFVKFGHVQLQYLAIEVIWEGFLQVVEVPIHS